MRDKKTSIPPPNPTRPESERLGAAVREARVQQGLSQDDVAFAANVSPRTVFAIEKGKSTVRLDMLARVMAAVGLELSIRPRDRVWRPGSGEG
jgi:HTH-type transcriptional regulator/antitoxin HipB